MFGWFEKKPEPPKIEVFRDCPCCDLPTFGQFDAMCSVCLWDEEDTEPTCSLETARESYRLYGDAFEKTWREDPAYTIEPPDPAEARYRSAMVDDLKHLKFAANDEERATLRGRIEANYAALIAYYDTLPDADDDDEDEEEDV